VKLQIGGRSSRAGRSIGAWMVAAVVGACLLAPAASANDGFLDEGFGSSGRVFTPAGFNGPWSQVRVQLAEAPDGGIVVAAETEMARYLADGELDPGFGEGGLAHIGLPGRLRFALGDLGVDPAGRPVVIGTARGGRASFATVLRYQRDGELDPSFGGGDGIVITNFGLPPAPGRRAAAATATLGAVDKQGRVTLIAGAVQRAPACGGRPRSAQRDRLIVRLTPEGTPDTTFGDGSVGRLGPLETVESMVLDGGGAVLAGTPHQSCGSGQHLAVIRVRTDGSVNRRFGERGSRRLTGSAAALALDGRGRIVLLCKPRQLSLNKSVTKIARLLPDGRFDPSFSSWHALEFEGPLWRLHALAVDARERPLLVGTLIHPLSPRNHAPFHRWFAAMPLSKSGDEERGFGWLGWLAITRFDPRSDLAASEALVDGENRLVIAGTGLRPRLSPQPGFALARYELGP
jgi:uncharacterized delta-60 repeat protein